jgi:Domain of unknown function (DUF4926)
MIRELETVVLARDIPEHGLAKGDVGAVVHCYADGDAYEVEFVTADGRTVAVLTLKGPEIRPIGRGEILHVRELASA